MLYVIPNLLGFIFGIFLFIVLINKFYFVLLYD